MDEVYRIAIKGKSHKPISAKEPGLARGLVTFLLNPVGRPDEFPRYLSCVMVTGEWMSSTDGRRLHRVRLPEGIELPDGTYHPETARSSLYLRAAEYDFPKLEKAFPQALMKTSRRPLSPTELATVLTMDFIKLHGMETFMKNQATIQTRYATAIFATPGIWTFSFAPTDGDGTPCKGAIVAKTDVAEAYIMPLIMPNII